MLQSHISDQEQTSAVLELIDRTLTSGQSRYFSLRVDQKLSDGSYDIVKIEPSTDADRVVAITGNSGIAVAYGVHHYLREACHCHFSWDGNQTALPDDNMPKWTKRAELKSMGRFRYFGNVCTFSYSMVWWDWPTWEKHIDWMALHGINLPLSILGQEEIWRRVYTQLGLTDDELLNDFFTGPAFFAWHRMGNLKKWCGPLSRKWLADQLDLQKRIIKRERQLGMTPVLPGFAGHVPDGVARMGAKLSNLTWISNWECGERKFLDPHDPLFAKIARMFMEAMKKEFGIFGAYNSDPFNEMAPPTYEPSYLEKTAKLLYESMSAVDPDAVWVLQGWTFSHDLKWQSKDYSTNPVEAFLSGIPQGRVLVLDLYSEQKPIFEWTKSCYGQPFIWNLLENFGGRNVVRGCIDKINNGFQTAAEIENSTLDGIGLTMEGLFTSYPLYEFALDRAWSTETLDLEAWHDLVDITREVLSTLAHILHEKCMTAYQQKNGATFQKYSAEFINILDDLDAVLHTHKNFLLGPWLQAATKSATSTDEAALFRKGFRNQITMWGPFGEINDYAAKMWAGLVKGYYRKRWKIYFDELQHALDNKTQMDNGKIEKMIFQQVEQPFTENEQDVATEPIGDSRIEAEKLAKKYAKYLA